MEKSQGKSNIRTIVFAEFPDKLQNINKHPFPETLNINQIGLSESTSNSNNIYFSLHSSKDSSSCLPLAFLKVLRSKLHPPILILLLPTLLVSVKLGAQTYTAFVRDFINALTIDQKIDLLQKIESAASEVLTRYDITWNARREKVQNVLRDAGIVIVEPDSFTMGDDFEAVHDQAYNTKNSIADRITLYSQGLQIRCNREYYYSAEVYRVVSEVHSLLS